MTDEIEPTVYLLYIKNHCATFDLSNRSPILRCTNQQGRLFSWIPEGANVAIYLAFYNSFRLLD